MSIEKLQKLQQWKQLKEKLQKMELELEKECGIHPEKLFLETCDSGPIPQIGYSPGPGILHLKGSVDPEKLQKLKKEWDQMMRGASTLLKPQSLKPQSWVNEVDALPPLLPLMPPPKSQPLAESYLHPPTQKYLGIDSKPAPPSSTTHYPPRAKPLFPKDLYAYIDMTNLQFSNQEFKDWYSNKGVKLKTPTTIKQNQQLFALED